jgi:hypothetical protein
MPTKVIFRYLGNYVLMKNVRPCVLTRMSSKIHVCMKERNIINLQSA